MADCEINCDTLICETCKKKAISCKVRRTCFKESMKITNGPGTELKKLLSRIGIDSTSGCKCSDRAKHMDYMEQKDPGWTERNIEQVVDWMEQEARNRNLPFLRTPAKMLVKLAIRRAKKE